MIETRDRHEPEHVTQPVIDVAKWVRWRLGAFLVLLATTAWFLSPALRSELSEMVRMMASGRVDALGERLASYGLWGPLVSLGIMVLQGILAPIPAFVVTFANGLAFGSFAGWLISLVGHALASSVCFAVARRLGRGRVESLVTKRGLGAADRWLERWGPQAVFLTRLVPGISFDGISYAAGLTSISFKRFVVATTLGVIPETLLFAYLGHAAHQHAPLVMGISFAVCLCGLVVAVLLGRSEKSPPD
ncbi:TVP38/TMEM64 family protein [soil metagenome]